MSDAYVPMPDTCHPYYADDAATVRRHLHLPAIKVAEHAPMFASYGAEPDPLAPVTRTRILTVKKCAGPAPFVGDPRWENGVYWWKVAVDDLGRHVAGPAALHIYPEPGFLRNR